MIEFNELALQTFMDHVLEQDGEKVVLDGIYICTMPELQRWMRSLIRRLRRLPLKYEPECILSTTSSTGALLRNEVELLNCRMSTASEAARS